MNVQRWTPLFLAFFRRAPKGDKPGRLVQALSRDSNRAKEKSLSWGCPQCFLSFDVLLRFASLPLPGQEGGVEGAMGGRHIAVEDFPAHQRESAARLRFFITVAVVALCGV